MADKVWRYFARGPFCWGRGDTIKEALQNMKRNWPTGFKGVPKRVTKKGLEKKPDLVNVFESKNGGIRINDFGDVAGPEGTRKLELAEWIGEL